MLKVLNTYTSTTDANLLNIRSKKNGGTAFHAAASGGHLNVLDLLLQRGMCVLYCMCIVHAIYNNMPSNLHDVLLYIHTWSTDASVLNVRDMIGRAALQFAAAKGHVNVLDWLLQRGMCSI